MHWYKLHVSYDGTEYHGWQMQDNVPTITSALLKSFARTFQRPMSLVGASRTDTGVHAYDQVVRCRTELLIDPQELCIVWNRALPPEITIRRVEVADTSFHPQLHVLQKTYWYHLFLSRPLPFLARYGWWYDRTIDVEKLKACLAYAVGTQDFRSFCTGDGHTSTTRTIDSIEVRYIPRYNVLRIEVRGRSFLHRMIRRLVGGAVWIASHRMMEPALFEKTLTACNPLHTLPTAPAHGLLLRKIKYGTRTEEEIYERELATAQECLELARGSE